MRNLIIIFLCYLSLHSHCVLAAEIQVGNAAQLNDVLAAANAGDVIKLKDGTYTGEFTLANSGTSAAPIMIKAANPGQAVFSNDSIMTLVGDYAVVTGCLFNKSKVYVRGDNNRISRNWFRNGRRTNNVDGAVHVCGGRFNRIDHNEIGPWYTYAIRVRKFGSLGKPWTELPRQNRIDHNYIHDMTGERRNGNEAIQLGSGAEDALVDYHTLLEYNLIERAEIDSEMISVKSNDNTIRYNTFMDSKAAVNTRHGDRNRYINNTIINLAALAIYADDNEVIGNKLENTPLVVRNGNITKSEYDSRVENGETGMNKHPAAFNTLVAGNEVVGSFISVGGRIPHGNAAGGIPATNTTLAQNMGTIEYHQHENTKVLPIYSGEIGTPVRVTMDMVGPDAPDISISGVPSDLRVE